MPESSTEALQIFIVYEKLEARVLGKLLSDLSFISTKIAEDYFSRFNFYENEEMPTLDIESVQTGNSIKFSLAEGWKVKITSNAEADIVVEIPKKLGIPILLGYLIVSIATGYQDYRIKQRDYELKEIEIQLKRIELGKALALDNEENPNTFKYVSAYIENKVPEIKPVILDTIKSVLSNPDITNFKVNNIEIKNGDRK